MVGQLAALGFFFGLCARRSNRKGEEREGRRRRERKEKTQDKAGRVDCVQAWRSRPACVEFRVSRFGIIVPFPLSSSAA